jgi:hypothetical protein
MSVEELIGLSRIPRPATGRLSPAGVRYSQRFQQLSKTEQRFVKKIMDLLLDRYQHRPVVSN